MTTYLRNRAHFIQKLKNLLQDDSAQATTEYIFMLAIGMGFATLVVRKLLKPTLERLGRLASASLEQQLFGADLHRFRIRR